MFFLGGMFAFCFNVVVGLLLLCCRFVMFGLLWFVLRCGPCVVVGVCV